MEDAQNITTSQKITTYRLDPRPSRFTIRVTASGLLSAFGHNPLIGVRDFSGEVQFDPEAAQSASLRMRVPSRSLEVADDVNEDDVNEKDRREIERIMHEQVLESNSYPTIEFQSNEMKVTSSGPGQFRAEISGELSLRGVTGHQTIVARVTASGERLRASGEFSLYQTEYGIQRVTAAGGALKVKDERKAPFEILASVVRAQDTAAA
jgi:polyisoprenoid-binding protein YceI